MWPFSRNKKKVRRMKTSSQNMITKVGSRMIRASSIDFFGSYSESDNKLYIVGWSDSDRSQGISGFRESGEGSYILGKDSKVLLSGNLQRPNDGKIANNGTFIINNWMFGEGLRGTFHAFDKSGEQLVRHLFEANLLNNGISNDGKYAVCQCANSDTDDGSMLAFFDLEAGTLLWRVQPMSGWADFYSFDSKGRYIYLEYRDKGKYRYNFDGKFLDEKRWETERVNFASPFELSFIAKEHLKETGDNLSLEKANKLLSLLNQALNKGIDEYPNEKANIYRTIGEIHEALGNIDDAIKNYEMALRLNQKVGVKRRLATLKKVKPNNHIHTKVKSGVI